MEDLIGVIHRFERDGARVHWGKVHNCMYKPQACFDYDNIAPLIYFDIGTL